MSSIKMSEDTDPTHGLLGASVALVPISEQIRNYYPAFYRPFPVIPGDCETCQRLGVPCVVPFGHRACTTCASQSCTCSKFGDGENCENSFIKRRKCTYESKSTAKCDFCAGHGVACVPAPTDKKSRRWLRGQRTVPALNLLNSSAQQQPASSRITMAPPNTGTDGPPMPNPKRQRVGRTKSQRVMGVSDALGSAAAPSALATNHPSGLPVASSSLRPVSGRPSLPPKPRQADWFSALQNPGDGLLPEVSFDKKTGKFGRAPVPGYRGAPHYPDGFPLGIASTDEPFADVDWAELSQLTGDDIRAQMSNDYPKGKDCPLAQAEIDTHAERIRYEYATNPEHLKALEDKTTTVDKYGFHHGVDYNPNFFLEADAYKAALENGFTAEERRVWDNDQPCRSDTGLSTLMCCRLGLALTCWSEAREACMGSIAITDMIMRGGAKYPVAEIWMERYDPRYLDFKLYLCVCVSSDPNPKPSWYGIVNNMKLEFVKITSLSRKPPRVMTKDDCRKTPDERFARLEGSRDFECNVHPGRITTVSIMEYVPEGFKYKGFSEERTLENHPGLLYDFYWALLEHIDNGETPDDGVARLAAADPKV